MTDVEDVDGVFAFVQRVDDSVCAWIFAKKQVAKSLVFWNDCAAFGESLQTINCLRKAIELRERTFGRVGFDVLVNGFQNPKGAIGQPNEVLHGCAGTLPALCAPDARVPFSGLPILDGCLPFHRLALRYPEVADRLRHPARLLRPFH